MFPPPYSLLSPEPSWVFRSLWLEESEKSSGWWCLVHSPVNGATPTQLSWDFMESSAIGHHADFSLWERGNTLGTMVSDSGMPRVLRTHPRSIPCRWGRSRAVAVHLSQARWSLLPVSITDMQLPLADCHLLSPRMWLLNVLCTSSVQCPGTWIGTQLQQTTLFILCTWR